MTPKSSKLSFLSLSHPLPLNEFDASQMVETVDLLLDRAREDLAALEADGESDDQSILQELDRLGADLESCVTLYSQLESLLGAPEIRDAMQEIQPKVSAFYTSVTFSEPLYKKIKSVAQQASDLKLNAVEAYHLRETLSSFKRNGAEVDGERKKRLREIEEALSVKTMRFARHVVEETDAFEWITEDESQLAGIPESARSIAAAQAQAKGRSGWRFTLQGPSFIAVMTYCERREVREHFYRAYTTRATRGERNNEPLIHEILALRAEKASLLGYRDVSDLFLEPRMVRSGEAAMEFVEELITRTRPFFEAETDALLTFAREELGWAESDELAAWDLSYIAEKMRRARCDFDEEELKPYLELKSVMRGMFEIVERLYQVQVRAVDTIATWHSDVLTYELTRDDEVIGVFYADLFPREGKQGGAWMCPLLYRDGVDTPQVGLISANFTPPLEGRSLLTHREVETLFHEFGHLLHHLLSEVELRSIAGTNVAWDFVELPSQIMENWCWEREALDLFARHVDDGSTIPEPLFQRLTQTRTFRGASGQMRQLTFASVDLKLHRVYQRERDGDALDYARREMQRLSAVHLTDDYAMVAGFTHLFASPTGYAAGYYSYKWAEVLDADAFTRFRDEGLFSPEVGQAFLDAILSRGGSADPAALFERFTGRAPSVEPLFERLGLTS